MKFKKIAKSLTGISTPVFGISWSPPETDREIVRQVITFFEDRRALYNPYNIETTAWVWEEYQFISHPQSPDFILNLPDYYAFFTYSMFRGKVAK